MADRQAMVRKQQFVDLMNNPESYFGKGCRLTLFPNGEHEIWIGNGRHGMRITASNGPRGLGITIQRFAGGQDMSVIANHYATRDSVALDSDYIEIVQFNTDPKAQAYKEWYRCDPQSPAEREEPNIKLAHQNGRAMAIQGKPLNDCIVPDPQAFPKENNAFRRGYWAQLAGLYHEEPNPEV